MRHQTEGQQYRGAAVRSALPAVGIPTRHVIVGMYCIVRPLRRAHEWPVSSWHGDFVLYVLCMYDTRDTRSRPYITYVRISVPCRPGMNVRDRRYGGRPSQKSVSIDIIIRTLIKYSYINAMHIDCCTYIRTRTVGRNQRCTYHVREIAVYARHYVRNYSS